MAAASHILLLAGELATCNDGFKNAILKRYGPPPDDPPAIAPEGGRRGYVQQNLNASGGAQLDG
jgi:hypothetical protein